MNQFNWVRSSGGPERCTGCCREACQRVVGLEVGIGKVEVGELDLYSHCNWN